MGVFIVAIVLLAVAAIIGASAARSSAPGSRAQVRRDFRRLRRSILRRVSKQRRAEVRELLDSCEVQLSHLSSAHYEHQIISGLIANAERLGGLHEPEAHERTIRVRTQVGRRLTELFTGLSRLSATAGLGTTDVVAELRDLTSSFEHEHDAFLQLTRELSSHQLDVRQEVS